MDGPPRDLLRSIAEANKLEVIIPCVGFDDMLAVTLSQNVHHLDHLIVVTTHEDAQTCRVAEEYGATVIRTDLFGHQGKALAKGAALNAALAFCQFSGWRLVLDADIILPESFRRILFNHTHLDPQCLYGADRVDVIGRAALNSIKYPQWGHREEVLTNLPIRARVNTRLAGYLPLGYFQLWHAESHKSYPSTAGATGLDDAVFAMQWPVSHRRLLPSVIVYHICAAQPQLGENWDGVRRHPRWEGV